MPWLSSKTEKSPNAQLSAESTSLALSLTNATAKMSMAGMGRDSTKKAIENFSSRLLKTPKKRTVRKIPPEKIVEKEVVTWLNTNGFSCHVVESKAVYNQKAGRYISGQTVPGFPDVVGCGPQGQSVWIELKAKGRRSTLRDAQRAFLRTKIKLGAFAVCIDSTRLLSNLWAGWSTTSDKEKFLLDALPKKSRKQNDPFDKVDENLGF